MRKHETSAIDIGQRLKAVRKRLHVQQKDMASAMKVASSYLSEIENGKGNPGPEFFVRLAAEYPINLHHLFMGVGDMLVDEDGKAKKQNIDLDEPVETVEQMSRLIEDSVYVRSVVMTCINKTLFEEKALIKENIKKKKTKEEAESKY
jgi:transcriptional regulator with XRE-family HTH domain